MTYASLHTPPRYLGAPLSRGELFLFTRLFNMPCYWAALDMCTCQIASTHQKFIDNLSARKLEGFFEELGPLRERERMVLV